MANDASRLAALLDPDRAAVVTSELQNGVVGSGAALPQLAAAAKDAVTAAARLVRAARAAGVPVVHCVAGRRPDGRGSNDNARLFAGVRRLQPPMLLGTAATEVVAEVGVAEGDLVLSRLHGLGPMGGTDLDAVLRNLGVRTVVVAGVSVNVAVTNLVMDAVNRGYQVVLPRDAIAGVPEDYAESVVEHTLSLLATVVTVGEVVEVWT
jgi:nicotinamidase-related amidase